MGLLDDLLGGALDNLFTGARNDKQLHRLATEGELVPATIYAIRVVHKSDTADQWYYASTWSPGAARCAPKRPDRVAIDWATAAERAAASGVVRNPADA